MGERKHILTSNFGINCRLYKKKTVATEHDDKETTYLGLPSKLRLN